MGVDLRLGPVSWNFENVQNLAVSHGFIKESLFPFLLRLLNLPNKCTCLDLRLGQVSCNYENVKI